MHFDYQLLQQPVTYGDASAYGKQKAPGSKAGFWFGIIFGAVAVVALLIVWLVAMNGDDIQRSSLLPVVYVGLAAVILVVCILLATHAAAIPKLKEELRVKRFAEANGIQFYSGPIDTPSNVSICNIGTQRTYDERLSFANQKVSEIGNIEFTIGGGKSQRTYPYSYARIKLPRKLPHILLDSRKNDGFLGLDKITALQFSVGQKIDENQKMQLEGDFNDYFTLYVPQGYAQDALYVFTPDVMQLMVDLGARFDAEIIDDDLYIFQPKHIEFRDGTQMEELITLSEKMQPEFASQTARYADERAGNSNLNVVSQEGQRLKTPVKVRPVFIVLAAVVFVMIFGLFLLLIIVQSGK